MLAPFITIACGRSSATFHNRSGTHVGPGERPRSSRTAELRDFWNLPKLICNRRVLSGSSAPNALPCGAG